MATITHTLTKMMLSSVSGQVSAQAGVTVAQAQATGNEELVGEYAIASNAANAEFDFAVTRSKCQSLVLQCDQYVTILVNSTGAPVATIVLPAGTQWNWNVNDPVCVALATLITADITKIYVTNTGATTAGTLKMRALLTTP